MLFDPRVPIPGMGGVFIIDDEPLTMEDAHGNLVNTTYGELIREGSDSAAARSAPGPAGIPETVTWGGEVWEVVPTPAEDTR